MATRSTLKKPWQKQYATLKRAIIDPDPTNHYSNHKKIHLANVCKPSLDAMARYINQLAVGLEKNKKLRVQYWTSVPVPLDLFSLFSPFEVGARLESYPPSHDINEKPSRRHEWWRIGGVM